MVTFKASTKKLIEAFRQLKVGVGRMNLRNKSFRCEITVTDNLVTFTVPGFQNMIPCKTNGTVKITVNFFRLFDIIIHEKREEMLFEIGEETMKMGILTIPVLTCYFKDDRILRSMNLPINFKDIDLLRLEQQGYTIEEIQFNKLLFLVTKAESNLDANIEAAFRKLNEYGISYKELETLVKNKIYGSGK